MLYRVTVEMSSEARALMGKFRRLPVFEGMGASMKPEAGKQRNDSVSTCSSLEGVREEESEEISENYFLFLNDLNQDSLF